MNKYEQLEFLNKSNDSDIYKYCYQIYKKEYFNNQDFSIQDEDLTEEIDELLNEYDLKVKNRIDNDSSSIYSDILSEIDISTNSNSSESNVIRKNSKTALQNSGKSTSKVVKKFSDKRIFDLPELKTDLDDDHDIQINNNEKEGMKEDIKNAKNIKNDPDIVIYDEKERKGSIVLENNNTSAIDDLEYTKSDIYIASRMFNSKLLTNDILITNPSIFTHNSIISKKSFVQSSNMNFDMENDLEYNKNSIDNNEIKKSEPNFMFSPKMKNNSNMFSNISNINQDQDLGFQKLLSSNMNSINNPNNENANNSSNSSHNIIPTDLTIQHSQKFLSISKNNISNSVICEDLIQNNNIVLTKSQKIEKFFENVSLKNFIYNVKMDDFNPSDFSGDEFIIELINLIEKNRLNEDALDKLALHYPNRYEVSFLRICIFYRELRTIKRDSKLRKNTPLSKDKILNELKSSSQKLKRNEYLIDINKNNIYVFKPLCLLKLWDKFIDESDIETFDDINKYFYIKLSFISVDLIFIFSELKVIIENENVFDKSIIFIYYFGKFIKVFITELENEDSQNFKTKYKNILSVIKDRDEVSYNKIFNIMKKFINLSKNNRRKANTYLNLVKISQFYKIDDQKIEIFTTRAKKLLDSFLEQNRSILKNQQVSDTD